MDQSQARSCHTENKCKDKELRPQSFFGNERMATSLFLMIGGTMDKQEVRGYVEAVLNSLAANVPKVGLFS